MLNRIQKFLPAALGFMFITGLPFSLAWADEMSLPEETENNDSSFTQYVQETKASEQDEENENTTWLNNLVSKVAEKSSQAFSNDKNNAVIQTKRSNASVFDIAGVMLRMDRLQVIDALQKRGYKQISEHMEIPNFIRWRYEEQCRNQGIIGFERISNCVYLLAKKNNYLYAQEIKFSNFYTKENMDIFLTSNFTGNKVYRIMYETEAANIVGSGAKADYLRNLKVFDFWKKINQKYGEPDNKEQITWGLGDKKPSLKAATGKLLLEDPMLLELDYTRMSREDKKFMNTAVYTF